jgi:hypothetical protein
VKSCLTRRWVCRLQLLLALISAVILRSESRGTHDNILLSQIRDSSNLEGQAPVCISPRNWVGQLYPQSLESLFRHLLRLAGLGWRYSTPPPHETCNSETVIVICSYVSCVSFPTCPQRLSARPCVIHDSFHIFILHCSY